MATRPHQVAEQFSRAYERSKDVLDEASGKAKVLYHDAREWVPKHRGTVAAASSIAIGCYAIGYLTGRGSRPRPVPPSTAVQTMTAVRQQLPELDLAPFFKFISLWMLYRVATKV